MQPSAGSSRQHLQASTAHYPQPRKQLPKQLWESFRPLITSQYIDQNKTAPQIVKLLRDRGLETSVRAVRGHIATWRLNCKNNRIDLRHLKAIYRKQEQRKKQGRPEAVYRVAGRTRTWTDIVSLQRISIGPHHGDTSPEDEASTPSDLEVLTPRSISPAECSSSPSTPFPWPPSGATSLLVKRPDTPVDCKAQAFTLTAIENWYQSLIETGKTSTVADFDYYDLFWDTHDALGLALAGVKAGWDALYSIGDAEHPRASLMVNNPKCFVMALHRISWLRTFALSYDDSLNAPDNLQQQILNVVQMGLERELTSLHANHPLETLFRKVAGQCVDEELGQHVLRLALRHFRHNQLLKTDSPELYDSDTIEVQTLFASTLTMLGKFQEAQELLLNARHRAAQHNDKVRELAASSALGTLWAFMSAEDTSYLMKSYELHNWVWSEAKNTVLAQCGMGRYMLYGLADLCRLLPGREDEAMQLFKEAIDLHHGHPAQPNKCWELTQVRHLHRMYNSQGMSTEAKALHGRHPDAFILQV